MSKSKVVLDLDGFTQIRQSQAVKDVLNQAAEQVAERANNMALFDYSPVRYKAVPARTSEKGSVALVTTQGDLYATLDNAQNNTLRKALTAGE